MKRLWICIIFGAMLMGCAPKRTVETVNDELLQPVMAQVGEIDLDLPDSALTQAALSSEAGKLYLCDDYCVTVQTMPRGDLDRTCRSLCGLSADALKLIETSSGAHKRWDWVWTTVGENGDCIGRAAVIDDGKYHYCVTVMADAELAGELEGEWTALLRSFSIR